MLKTDSIDLNELNCPELRVLEIRKSVIVI